MQLTVKLFAGFRTGRFDVERREVEPGTTLGALLDELRIRREEVGVLLVAGRHATFDDAPSDGATVAVFPLVGGG